MLLTLTSKIIKYMKYFDEDKIVIAITQIFWFALGIFIGYLIFK